MSHGKPAFRSRVSGKAGKYFARRGCVRELLGTVDAGREYLGAVIIPACGESDHLPATLASLAANSATERAQVLVCVVLNNPNPEGLVGSRRASAEQRREDNLKTRAWLEREGGSFGFSLGWIDAVSPGCELNPAGVGMARKVGCDTVLARGIEAAHSAVGDWLASFQLLHLDADTWVEPSYLGAVRCCLSEVGVEACTVPFAHQSAANATEQAAIDGYELFLRLHVAGLRWAGSPYAYHAMGSAMASTAGAYIRAGGMSAKRRAGEDFYFLQELAKTGSIGTAHGTVVHPSARLSERTPFGTGAAMRRALGCAAQAYPAYDPRVYGILRDLYCLVNRHSSGPVNAFTNAVADTPAASFLQARGLLTEWPRFYSQFAAPASRVRAFHGWFDALAEVRLIHALSASLFPRVEVLAGWHSLGKLANLSVPEADVAGVLDWARRH